MSRRLGVAAGVALVALLGAVPSGAHYGLSRPRSCTPPHSKTIVRNDRARVFKRYEASRESWFIWGCAFETGKAWFLGFPEERGVGPFDVMGNSSFVLNGPFVGYVYDDFEGRSDPPHEIDVIARDLRTGRVVHEWAGQWRGPCADYRIRVMVLNHRGSLGWLAEEPCDHGYAILAADRARRGARLLDEGPGIDPALTLRAGRLVWVKNGRRKSTRLR